MKVYICIKEADLQENFKILMVFVKIASIIVKIATMKITAANAMNSTFFKIIPAINVIVHVKRVKELKIKIAFNAKVCILFNLITNVWINVQPRSFYLTILVYR